MIYFSVVAITAISFGYSNSFVFKAGFSTNKFLGGQVQHTALREATNKWSLAAVSTAEAVKDVSAPPQLIKFKEPQTNVTVILVGAMHYNPASIKLARETVDNLGRKEQLGSVIIETCDIRWNDTGIEEDGMEAKFFETFLMNEMRAAHDTSLQYSRPVILGDQRINITSSRIGQITKQVIFDIFSPFNGGWERFYNEVRSSSEMALPSKNEDEDYIGANGLLDPRLLMAMPATLVQYPLSWLIKAPLGTIFFGVTIFLLNYLGDATMLPPDADMTERVEDIYSSLLFSAFETLLFARIFVTVMLAERNEVIAQNILEQCKIYAGTTNDISTRIRSFSNRLFQQLPPLFGSRTNVAQTDTATSVFTPDQNFEIVYAPKSPIPDVMDEEDKVVVAVLGMAHCNGVFKLLKDGLLK